MPRKNGDGRNDRTLFQRRASGTDYKPPSKKDLDEITVVAFTIEERSAKAWRGGPRGPLDEADDAAGTRGIVELG